jgi:DNA (cytosine-5)-methyltransferase 1
MITNHIARRVGPLVQERINHLAIGDKMQDLPEELWHKSFRFYVKEDPNRQGGPNLRMLRLDPDKPSPTVTGYVFNKFVHPFEDRFITVREAARLQGFPDAVKFEGTLTSTQLQIGNAVPIPLAKAVFETILQSATKYGFHNNLTALSLFSGAGGTDIGATEASYKEQKICTKIALDKWQDACKTLQGYVGPSTNVIQQDIAQIREPLQFWQTLSTEMLPPDLVYGGPPCQSFSQAGKQKGTDDDRGQLIFEFLRFIEALHPPFFFMENVSNLKGVGGGLFYDQIIKRMQDSGYNTTVGALLAADFGAPQLRRRLLFLGCRKDIGALPLPEPTHCETNSLFLQPYTTVGQAFTNLPDAAFSNYNPGYRHQQEVACYVD